LAGEGTDDLANVKIWRETYGKEYYLAGDFEVLLGFGAQSERRDDDDDM